jgi:L-2,4-diaminobutyric acid acetyltransferase
MIASETQTSRTSVNNMHFRTPSIEDGLAVWRLVQATGTLEVNTAYFYLIFCEEFQNSCLLAEQDGQVVGVVLGFRRPKSIETLFCWQIGVLPSARGQGLAKQMLKAWIRLAGNESVTRVQASVAKDNVASDRLFRAFARDLGAQCNITPWLASSLLPSGHNDEPLYDISPIGRQPSPQASSHGAAVATIATSTH